MVAQIISNGVIESNDKSRINFTLTPIFFILCKNKKKVISNAKGSASKTPKPTERSLHSIHNF